MQLDALLRSMQKYAPQCLPATVIVKVSDEKFLAGYSLFRGIQRELLAGGDLIWQSATRPFRMHVMTAICSSPELCTMLLVDDCVFYRQLPDFGFPVRGNQVYAPRLGQNCTYCYPIDRQQAPGEMDFQTLVSLDGHVYRTVDLVRWLASIHFATPNELEHYLGLVWKPRVTFGEHSCLVGIPHNRVQEAYPNRNMGGSAAELNARFLRGERIDLDAMDFSDVRGCHQEIEYVFTKAV